MQPHLQGVHNLGVLHNPEEGRPDMGSTHMVGNRVDPPAEEAQGRQGEPVGVHLDRSKLVEHMG